MSRSHRGRKGDGWPKGHEPIVPIAGATRALMTEARTAATYPDVCAQDARCGHVICSIVWYCMEAT